MGAIEIKAREKNLGLTSSVARGVPDALMGDAGRLRQIVLNLAGNAIKFTERGEVALEVSSEEVAFTKGRIIVRGKLVTRGKAKRADYILYYKPNISVAIIEAKDNNHSVGDGMQQALDYAATLNIAFVFSSSESAWRWGRNGKMYCASYLRQ